MKKLRKIGKINLSCMLMVCLLFASVIPASAAEADGIEYPEIEAEGLVLQEAASGAEGLDFPETAPEAEGLDLPEIVSEAESADDPQISEEEEIDFSEIAGEDEAEDAGAEEVTEAPVAEIPEVAAGGNGNYYRNDVIKVGEKVTINAEYNKNDFTGDTEVASAKVISGEVPGLEHKYSPLLGTAYLTGTPTKPGYYTVKAEIRLKNGRTIYHTYNVLVKEAQFERTSEDIFLRRGQKKTVYFNDAHSDIYYSIVKRDGGKIPDGMSYAGGKDVAPRYSGTPAKNGTYEATYEILYYNGKEVIHTVKAHVYDDVTKNLEIDLTQGSYAMPFMVYMLPFGAAYSTAIKTKRIEIGEDDLTSSTTIDLDKDGWPDVRFATEKLGEDVIFTKHRYTELKSDYYLNYDEEMLKEASKTFDTDTLYNIVFRIKPYTKTVTKEGTIEAGTYYYEIVDDEEIGGVLQNVKLINGKLPDGMTMYWHEGDIGVDQSAPRCSGRPIKPGKYTATYRMSYSNGDALQWVFNLNVFNPFTDVPEDKYYYEPIIWAKNIKYPQITSGTSKTEFSPNDPCTRAQVVTFLWRAAGEPTVSGAKNPFKDVQNDKYYYKAVLWAVEKGITAGTSKTTFSPDAPCTRGQVVTFLHRFEGKPKPAKTTNPFKDVKSKDYFADAVIWAYNRSPQITGGTSKTEFSPGATCTRAQVVTFLYRDLN